MRTFAKYMLALAGAMLLGACGTVGPSNSEDAALLHQRTQATLSDMKRTDPSLTMLLNSAHAYVLFPEIAMGGIGIGGAHGEGEVYEKGKLVGYADVSQGSIGLQLGGQVYSELVLFRTELPYINFKSSSMEFDARVSAVAASAGAAAAADYSSGVLVVTMPQGGLMYQAAVGGQQFRFRPVGP